MLIPWRVDVPQDRWPIGNWLIVAGICLAFAAQVADNMSHAAEREQQAEKERLENPSEPESSQPPVHRFKSDKGRRKVELPKGGIFDYVLNGWTIKGLFGHMWLHGGIIHLAGNLIFLWVFGNAVCSKIGNLIYIPLYVLFGVLAAIMHLIFVGGPMIGASGAVFGVVGMYLVFFWENEITCYWAWFLFFGRSFTISGYWIILMWLFFNLSGVFCSSVNEVRDGVAYFAHLGGFTAGFVAAIVMLKTKRVTMERYERSILQIFSKEENNGGSLVDRRYTGFERELKEAALEEKQEGKITKLAEKSDLLFALPVPVAKG
ncbi:MAG: rhomboid family intramembrane serine protease [Planctomycetota bacterium]|nr:rhomboid family intramembrane serine protease [Planctomycetota bacterium]